MISSGKMSHRRQEQTRISGASESWENCSTASCVLPGRDLHSLQFYGPFCAPPSHVPTAIRQFLGERGRGVLRVSRRWEGEQGCVSLNTECVLLTSREEQLHSVSIEGCTLDWGQLVDNGACEL